MTLTEVNELDRDAFVGALGHLFEHSPWVVAETWRRRPFASRAALLAAMADVLRSATPDMQLAMIEAHPDLAGKAARAGELTDNSTREQAGAGLDQLNEDEFARFHRLNAAYRAKFDFPFIICVRAHDKTSILSAFEWRTARDTESERAQALHEIEEIVRLRLADLVEET